MSSIQKGQAFQIRSYAFADEFSWLRCRLLAFFDTAYFDDVLRDKPVYQNPSIELVAVIENQVVGLIDIEYETSPGSICSTTAAATPALAGMIWHIAVHPDYRRQGIGETLLNEAKQAALAKNLTRLEAWTRDDPFVNSWYQRQGFIKKDAYYHVYMNGEEIRDLLNTNMQGLHPTHVFAHYSGKDLSLLKQFDRVHECMRYDLSLTTPPTHD